MPPTSATNLQLRLLWDKAKKAGFSAESLRRMLVLLNLHPKTITTKDLRNVWPYVNEINAQKFNY